LGDYLDRYAVWLSEQGFCWVHARLQLVQIADFGLWLDKRGLTIIKIQPATIDSHTGTLAAKSILMFPRRRK
jgi:hypothetical protein